MTGAEPVRSIAYPGAGVKQTVELQFKHPVGQFTQTLFGFG